jgi:purine-binding chemotaxis protein CheW
LEQLINAIDQQVDQVPHLSPAEGLAAFLGERPEDFRQQGEKYVRFLIAGTTFALPLENTLEIDYFPDITPLPNLPQWVLGICNLRGDIVSVVDIKQIFKLSSKNVNRARKLVLIRNQNVSTAIVVDNVAGILVTHEQDHQNDTNPMAGKPFSKFVKNAMVSDRQTVYFLDLDVLMTALKT